MSNKPEPIIGWREWFFLRPGFLCDRGHTELVMPRQRQEANCFYHTDHLAPVINCSCGIYAYKTRSTLLQDTFADHDVTMIFGEVSLWGRVIEHYAGYRAQFAYPKHLYITGSLAPQIFVLANSYGIPCDTLSRSEFSHLLASSKADWLPSSSHRPLPPTKTISVTYACGHTIMALLHPKLWDWRFPNQTIPTTKDGPCGTCRDKARRAKKKEQ